MLWAAGESPEGFGSWEGAFVLKLADGGYAFVFGWCDTTGWGCQDDAYLYRFADHPTPEQLRAAWADEMGASDFPRDGDQDPADLNRWVQGEVQVPN